MRTHLKPDDPPCDHIFPRLTAYLDNETAPPERDVISAHMAHCETCRAEKEYLEKLWAELGEMPAPKTPSGLSGKILSVIEAEDGEASAAQVKRMKRFRLFPLSAAVAAMGLLVGGWLAWTLLDAEANRQAGRSLAATMDIFAPNPRGTFVGGYIAMLGNPGGR